MNIFLCCDNGYAKYIPPLIISIYENNKAKSIDVYVAHLNRISQENQDLIIKTGEQYNQDVYFVVPEDITPYSRLRDMTTSAKMYRFGDGDSSFLKFSAAELLPEFVNRCLYLDIDVIVDSSLENIYNIDLQGNTIASRTVAFIEKVKELESMDIKQKSALGDSNEYPFGVNVFFGSGVVLMDLSNWREQGKNIEYFVKLKSDFINKYGNIESGVDCILLNWAFWNKCLLIGDEYPGFNLVCNKYNYNRKYKKYEPMIIHFANQHICKPWKYRFSKEQIKKYLYFGDWTADKPALISSKIYIWVETWWKYAEKSLNYSQLEMEAKDRTNNISFGLYQELYNAKKYIENCNDRLRASSIGIIGSDILGYYPDKEFVWEQPRVCADFTQYKIYKIDKNKTGRVLFPTGKMSGKIRLHIEMSVNSLSGKIKINQGNSTNKKLVKEICVLSYNVGEKFIIEETIILEDDCDCIFFSQWSFKHSGEYVNVYKMKLRRVEDVEIFCN